MHTSIARFLLLLVLIAPAALFPAPPASASPNAIVETFETDAMKDGSVTTAAWARPPGTLALAAFEYSELGNWDTFIAAKSVAVSGDVAYLATGTGGLQILDISDPTDIRIIRVVGNLRTNDVSVRGDIVFTADETYGLVVIDVGDPSSPRVLRMFTMPGAPSDICVDGDVAYVVDYLTGLHTVDVSNPEEPVLLGQYPLTRRAAQVAVSGNLAVLAATRAGLLCLDVEDPANPLLVGRLEFTGLPVAVTIDGDRAYVTDETGLQLVDIADPSAPAMLGRYDTGSPALSVAVAGDLALVGDASGTIHLVDVDAPLSPTLVRRIESRDSVAGITIVGDEVYAAVADEGMVAIDFQVPAYPEILGSSPQSMMDLMDVALDGDVAYAVGARGLFSLDIDDRSAPRVLDSLPFGSSTSVAVAGDDLYLAMSTGWLRSLDVSDPSDIRIVSQLVLDALLTDLAVAGNRLYVAGGGAGLFVVDATHPADLRLLGRSTAVHFAEAVAVRDDIVFVSDKYMGVAAVDMSDPTAPALLGTCPVSQNVYGLGVFGPYVFVAAGDGGLLVVDAADPAAMTVVATMGTPGPALGVEIDGDMLYLGCAYWGLIIVDIGDPRNPQYLHRCDTPGKAWGLAVRDDVAMVADGEAGLQVVRIVQRERTRDRNVAGSLVYAIPEARVMKVRLNTVQTPSVDWEVAAAGHDFAPVAPGDGWADVNEFTDGLQWRARLEVVAPDAMPDVSELRIEWLPEAAAIDSVVDVPGDQGGWVRVFFTRSGRDFPDEAEAPVVSYSLYRRVDAWPREDEPAPPKGTQPPGVWELVGTQLPRQCDSYVFLAPTLADFSALARPAVFHVLAHTASPAVWYASPPDSGWSLDNVAPHVPLACRVDYSADRALLTWEPAPDPDLYGFRIYRGDTADFVADAGSLLGETTATLWIDLEGGRERFYHYKVSAVDAAGNESEAVRPEALTDVPAGGTAACALHAGVPNPFNPATTLAFTLPDQRRVELAVFDARGRRVRQLLDGVVGPGRHEVRWDGTGDDRRPAASGAYLCRLRAGSFSATRRLTLVR